MPKPQLQPGSTALVTGASAGIGLELSRVLAAHGHDLVLVARRRDVLDRVAAELSGRHGVAVTVLPADLADPDAPVGIHRELRERGIAIDILVNNAGFGLRGTFAEMDEQRIGDMLQVNVSALTLLTRLFLPGMVQRGRGRVLQLASTAAFQPGPLMAEYYATKAYVLSFSQAIAEELRQSGVTITALCPGPTRTEFADVAGMQSSRLFGAAFVMTARDVAEYGYRAMMRGRRVAIPGVVNRLVAFSTRLAPRRLSTAVARMAQEHR
jgi:short-subunit dehydrogenase